MGLFEKEEDKIEDVYIGLRQQAFGVKPENKKFYQEGVNLVFGAVVDMPVSEATVSLFCSFDGTVSLYFSNGGGLLGSGQEYETVSKAGREFLYNASQTLSYLSTVTDTTFVKKDITVVYLLASQGIYKMEYDMNQNQSEEYKSFLNHLIQRVLNALRDSGAMNY